MIRGDSHRMSLVLAALAAIGFRTVAFTQQPTFSAKIAAVRVGVSVTDRGKLVSDLHLQDFEVRDNGVLQKVDLATFEHLPLNVHLALDLSHSVSGERLRDVKAAGHAILDGLAAKDKASLLTFNQAVDLREPLTADLPHLRSVLDATEPSGDTALYDATYAAMLASRPDEGRDLMLVFSDGQDTASWLAPEDVLESARRADMVIFGLSPPKSQSARFLRALGTATGGEAFEVDATRDLKSRFVRILNEFRQRYLVSYSPQGVQRGGWHKLEVKLKGRSGTVRARPGYLDRDE